MIMIYNIFPMLGYTVPSIFDFTYAATIDTLTDVISLAILSVVFKQKKKIQSVRVGRKSHIA